MLGCCQQAFSLGKYAKDKVDTQYDFLCESCALFFACGVFVSRGSAYVDINKDIRTIGSSGYKLAFRLNGELASEVAYILATVFDIDATLVADKLFVTGFENIRQFLAKAGATKCLFELENENVARQLRASASRATNAQHGNIKKQIETNEQLKKIVNSIDEEVGIDKLPSKLKEVCKLVQKEQAFSLDQIAKKLNISKSGVNHRIRAIRDIFRSI